MIGIINYGSGNIQALATIYKKINVNYQIIHSPDNLNEIKKIILPGVGSFDKTMQQLIQSGFSDKLNELVMLKKIPILGICVGLQVMGYGSEEGKMPGLGWIPGKVKRFNKDKINNKPKLPHMGWNKINNFKNHPIFKDIDYDFGFYFIHSYYFECENSDNILTTSLYGVEFASSIYNNNIFGMQFHPEKSHANGVQVLKNFAHL
tara:strand:- start:2695 stop:3309 length:615 start_codon:yes stop_codon:yes gene_type:complete